MQRRHFLKTVTTGSVAALFHERTAFPAEESVGAMTAGQLRQKLVDCLGGAWPEPGPLKPMARETINGEGYRIESLSYETGNAWPGRTYSTCVVQSIT
jgi:hypothetical protein